MHPGDSHIFDGTIEYVRVWNNLNALKSVPYWGFQGAYWPDRVKVLFTAKNAQIGLPQSLIREIVFFI